MVVVGLLNFFVVYDVFVGFVLFYECKEEEDDEKEDE